MTSGTVKVIRMAFNLYCNGTPSVDDYKKHEEQLTECRQYTVEELFCSGYARYFWEAIKIRYPEYCSYVDWEALYMELSFRMTDGTGLQLRNELIHKRMKNRF